MTTTNPELHEVVPAAEGCLFAASVSACVLAVFLDVITAAIHIVGPIQLTAMYEDFDVQLPAFTQWLIDLPIWLIVLCGALLAAGLVLKEILVHHHVVNFIINLAAVVLLLLWSAAIIVGLWLPLTQLIESTH